MGAKVDGLKRLSGKKFKKVTRTGPCHMMWGRSAALREKEAKAPVIGAVDDQLDLWRRERVDDVCF